jgi:hypothetical protein
MNYELGDGGDGVWGVGCGGVTACALRGVVGHLAEFSLNS